MWSHHSLRRLSDPPRCGIIGIPRLFYAIAFKLVDEWGYGNCIHGHRKRVTLSGAFLRVECASIYEELGIISIGVDNFFLREMGIDAECCGELRYS